MVTILPALRQVREDLAGLLERQEVERICRELEYTWRERQLDPYTTLHLFILQVVNKNTAMTHLPHLSGERFTASAYCQARQRLPLELLQRLVDSFARGIQKTDPLSLWRGHRVGLMDGSGFSMPDTAELQAYFGQPGGQKPGCGFPVAHMLALLDAHGGFLHDVIIAPLRTHDLRHAAGLHPKLGPGDIVVGDRGFCSYAHLALLLQANLHGVLRIHQRTIVDFHPHRPCKKDLPEGNTGMPTSRWVQRLGRCDQLVMWQKPESCPKWMNAEAFAKLPEEILVREIRCRIREKGCRVEKVTLVTTLLDPQRYPAAEIAKLYRLRWQVEVDLRDLKITLGMDVLKGHKVKTIKKEVLVYALVYNLVRLVALKAARRQGVNPHRISFIDALRWLQPSKPDAPLPDLVVNPIRPGRIEPRCIKRRPKKYDRMNQPRHELRKRLQKRRDAA
jgi:hypothetical protein